LSKSKKKTVGERRRAWQASHFLSERLRYDLQLPLGVNRRLDKDRLQVCAPCIDVDPEFIAAPGQSVAIEDDAAKSEFGWRQLKVVTEGLPVDSPDQARIAKDD
jgi:hypothetical protein